MLDKVTRDKFQLWYVHLCGLTRMESPNYPGVDSPFRERFTVPISQHTFKRTLAHYEIARS